MTSFFALFHGDRLEMFLVLLALLVLPYSIEARAFLRQIPVEGLRRRMEKADVARFRELKEIHGNAYQLVVAIVRRLISGVIHWSLISLAVIVLYQIGTFMSLGIMENRKVTMLAFLAVFAAPVVGAAMALLSIWRLLAELKEYEESVKAVARERGVA